jgi:hypothetical protein
MWINLGLFRQLPAKTVAHCVTALHRRGYLLPNYPAHLPRLSG